MKTQRLQISGLIAMTACVLCAQRAPGQAIHYTVEDLGTLSGPVNESYDITPDNKAVGRVLDAAWVPKAVLWSNDAVVTLGGSASANGEARGISSNGLIVGSLGPKAALWGGGPVQLLNALPGHVGSRGWDVNSSSLVIGWSANSAGDPTAVKWTGGVVTALDVNHSWAFAVNDAGQIIGRRDVTTGREARLWHNGTGVTLPDYGNNYASATNISPRGIITGGACEPVAPGVCKPKPVVWLGVKHELNTLADFPGALSQNPWAANDRGVIAGSISFDFDEQVNRGVIWWRPDQEPININTLIDPRSGWIIESANAINHNGTMAGFGSKSGLSGRRAIMLHPVNSADITNDAIVDVDDLLEVINSWGSCVPAEICPGDLTGDGVIDVDDLLKIINNWG